MNEELVPRVLTSALRDMGENLTTWRKLRQLTVQQLATAEETHTTIIADETAKAEEPLGLVNKIWTFIIPFRAFMISMTYRADGYDTKADDIRKWGLYGIGFYIVLMLLISRSC